MMDNTVEFGVIFCSTIYLSTKLIKDLLRCQANLSTIHRTILWGISLATFVQTLFGTSVLFLSSFKGGITDPGLQCQVDGFATSTTTFAIINQVAVLCYTTKAHARISHVLSRHIGGVVAACWVVPVLFAVLPFVGIGQYVPHGNGSFCCLDWSSTATTDRVYFYVMFLVAFIIPSLLILYSKAHMSTAVESSRDNKIAASNKNNEIITTELTNQPSEELIKMDTVFTTAMLFLALWLPYGATMLHSLLGFDTPGSVEHVAVIFGLSSYIVLPFVLSKQFSTSNVMESYKTERCCGWLSSFRICLHFLLFL